MKHKSGFTLIELSIVLVIIGLIVGGVLVGRDLIQAANIRAQIKQIDNFKVAANAFKLKYGYLPADIPPAEATNLGFFTFTGTHAGKTLLTAYNAVVGYTNNGFGDNNGYINRVGEQYVFWQHLSEAQMIEGQYGGSVSLGNYLEPSTNGTWSNAGVPISLPDFIGVAAGWSVFLPTGKFSHANKYVRVYSNYAYQKPLFTSPSNNYFGFFATPNQSYTIDTKTDDGFPASGTVRDAYSGNINAVMMPPCTTGATPNQYDLSTNPNIIDYCMIDFLW